GIDRQTTAVDRPGVGWDRDVGADRGDQAVANHHRASRDGRTADRFDPRVSDGPGGWDDRRVLAGGRRRDSGAKRRRARQADEQVHQERSGKWNGEVYDPESTHPGPPGLNHGPVEPIWRPSV